MVKIGKVFAIWRKRVFWRETTKRVLWLAALNAVISLVTALLTSVDSGKFTVLVVVSAVLSAVAAFSQTLREFLQHEQEGSNS